MCVCLPVYFVCLLFCLFVCLFVYLLACLFVFCRAVVKYCDCVSWEDHIATARERVKSEEQKNAEELKESLRIAGVGIQTFKKSDLSTVQ